MKKMSFKTYSELIRIQTFQERFEYLLIGGNVGDPTFGGHRYLNQILYKTSEWRLTRREVILRDDGYDLGHEDYPIVGNIYIHHINPVTIDDILNRRPFVFDLENLISTSFNTHNAIHYGDSNLLPSEHLQRSKNDTCPWKK